MNYIDEIARAIFRRTEQTEDAPAADEMALYRIYAVLALTTGTETTNEHVHDAWAAWRAATKPDHRSLVPFDRLTADVQELDAPYRDAIRAAAAERLALVDAPGARAGEEGA